ncbi:type II toxin-antitoxin system PemK/MazF family toxin [Streptomyces sp. NPDC091219]|uniref:type II toxin-antitoxin system PemK/MazF family toxin n=1 Tax=Streptomyces sp. NPDC091219 TaxID=3155193 RepID=UPI00344DC5EF
MNTYWWLGLAAVVLLALIATLVDGWGRGSSRRARGDRPRPAEIWWANVPYEDRPGAAKDRPCLVLAVRGRKVTVAKITSKNHEERGGVIPLPPGAVDDARGRASYLETGEVRKVAVSDFRRKVGVVDPVLWDQVRHLSG